MERHYIKAVLELLTKDSDRGKNTEKVLLSLKKTLEKHKHEKLYGAILRGVLREIEVYAQKNVPHVVVARDTDIKKHKNAIEEALKALGAEGTHTTTTDDTIIGGHIVTANNKRIDASYKGKLVDLYRSVLS